MAWNPDYIEDGDAATAASVNSRLQDAVTWLSDITSSGLRRGAFNHFHAGCLLQPNSAGYTVYNNEDGNLITYTHTVFTNSIHYSSHGAANGSSTGGDLGTGDRAIVGHPSNTSGYTGDTAQIDFPGSGIHVGMSNGDRCAAILLMFNCNVYIAEPDNGVPSPTELFAAVVFCIQYRLKNAGNWVTIQRTERFVSVEDHKSVSDGSQPTEEINFDVPITTLLTETIVNATPGIVGNASTNPVTNIRAMVTTYQFNAGGGTTSEVTITNFRLTALPLLAEDNS